MPYLRLLVVSVLLVLNVTAVASAATSGSVTQSYAADNALQRGMLVKLAAGSQAKVTVATTKDAASTAGVVVAANDAAVTLSDPTATSRQVFVAGAGRYAVLVSTQNGAIKANDYLTLSSLDGVAMKAGSAQTTAVGKALAGFDGSANSNTSGQATLKASDGKASKVSIGLIAVDLNIGRNPLQKSATSRIPGLGSLQTAAGAVVGKTVDPARLYVSLVVLLAIAAISGSILYGGVRSSIVSIGRNPLARVAIGRGLAQVVLVSIIIFIIGLFGIYLILKL